jgi:hypothetical protein
MLLLTMTLIVKPVLSSERAPHKDKTVTAKLRLIFGYESQVGLDTKTD